MRILLIFLTALAFFNLAHANQTTKYKVRTGDTIFSILKKFHFSNEQINLIVKEKNSFEQAYQLIPNQPYWVGADLALKKSFIQFSHPLKDEALILWKSNIDQKVSGLSLKKQNFDIKLGRASGKTNGSILQNIQTQIPSSKIAYRFLDAYKFQYDLKKVLQKGDQFSLVYEMKYLNGEFIKYGEVLKTSLNINKLKQDRYFIAYKQGGSFVNLNDLQLRRPLYAPVNYLKITSLFQKNRFHPIKKRRIAHLGVDFQLPLGSDVLASLAGLVINLGKNHAAGRYIVIQHKDNLKTYYNHLNSIDNSIKIGTKINSGQVIGAIGCSGYCTKPHLHFAVKKNNQYVNPAQYLKSYPHTQKETLWNKVSLLKKQNSKLTQ